MNYIYMVDFDVAIGNINSGLFFGQTINHLFYGALRFNHGPFYIFSSTASANEIQEILKEKTNFELFINKFQIIGKDSLERNNQSLSEIKRNILNELQALYPVNSHQFIFIDRDFSWTQQAFFDVEPKYFRVPYSSENKPLSSAYLESNVLRFPYNLKYLREVNNWITDPDTTDNDLEAFYHDTATQNKKASLAIPISGTLFAAVMIVGVVFLALSVGTNPLAIAMLSISLGIMLGAVGGIIGMAIGTGIVELIKYCSKPNDRYLKASLMPSAPSLDDTSQNTIQNSVSEQKSTKGINFFSSSEPMPVPVPENDMYKGSGLSPRS